MAVTHVVTYLLNGRDLRDDHDTSRPLSAFLAQQTYVLVAKPNKERVLVDLTKMLCFEPNVDATMTLAAFMAARFTDLLLTRYASTALPVKGADGRYAKRLESFDAHGDLATTVAFTSRYNPEARNDPYRRYMMNELVLSSPTRDFTHCLAAVNGVFHATYVHNGELFVVDGYGNMKNCKQHKLAVFDSASLGGHTTIPIVPSLVSNTPDEDVRQGVYLKLPDTVDLRGKTTLVVIDGAFYALDGTYQVLGPQQVKLHTCQMDLIRNFLLNPNTRYTHGPNRAERNPWEDEPNPLICLEPVDKLTHFVADIYPTLLSHPDDYANALVEIPCQDPAVPPVVDRMTHFVADVYPTMERSDQAKDAVLEYSYVPLYKTTPDLVDEIEFFLTQDYPAKAAAAAEPSGLALAFQYTEEAQAQADIRPSMPAANLTSKQFVLDRLFSPHSFLVVLNTPHVYTRRYSLRPAQRPDIFEYRGADTPRGILRYDQSMVVPYVITSAPDGQHMVYLDHHIPVQELYKTTHAPAGIPSPLFDGHDTDLTRHRVELLELYSP